MSVQHEQISRLLSGYLDDELSAEQRADVERHLSACRQCAEALAAWRRLRQEMNAWAAPKQPANAERLFWLQLAPRLPARPTRSGASLPLRELLFPMGLAAGSIFLEASAWLALAFSALMAVGAFPWLEPWLGERLGEIGNVSAGGLLRLTWPGWLLTEFLAQIGVTPGELEPWLQMLLGWATPIGVLATFSALIFFGLSGWAGWRWSRRLA